MTSISAKRKAQVQPKDSLGFEIVSPKEITSIEATWVSPDDLNPAAHDALTRLLHRLEPDPDRLWIELNPQVTRVTGGLVLR